MFLVCQRHSNISFLISSKEMTGCYAKKFKKDFIMPVPKKRQSKSRKNSRKFKWKQEASKQTNKALSKAKIVLKQLKTLLASEN